MAEKLRNNPPRWSLKLLRLFIRKEYLEEVEGDMEEVFADDIELFGHNKARRRYNWQMLKLIRPSLIHTLFNSQKFNYPAMLKHNILVTFRGFKRHKLTFFINLIGLSTGLAASLLILLWVQDERSVDTFHEKDDQLYWAMTHFELPAGPVTWNYTSGRLGRTMIEKYPEVEDAVWIGDQYFIPRGVLTYKGDNFETQGLFASRNFFEVFTYKLLNGNASEVLTDPSSIVLSRKFAISVFGSIDEAIGETIEFEDRLMSRSFVVTGIYESPPVNATKQFDMVINYDVLTEIDPWADHWNGGYSETFLVLKEGSDIDAFNTKIADFMDEYIENERFTLFVQKYSDNYLYGSYEDGMLVGGRIESVRLFTLVAVLILLIAGINFMNLSTAQAATKMKEIGVKKAIGAHRNVLIFQFLCESILISIFAMILAILLVSLLLPQFNAITGKQITPDLWLHLPLILTTVFITGLLAGSYPAFYLSGFDPVKVLKGKLSSLRGEELVRKGLVVVQFTLSVTFIVVVIIINQQIEFTLNKNLGYNRSNIITFESKGLSSEQLQAFLEELRNLPGVASLGNMAGDFLWGNDNGSGYWWGDDPGERTYLFKSPKMGYNTIETMGLTMVQGRSFDPKFNDHDDRIIINESAAKMMGLEEAAGKTIRYGESGQKEIIGVVKDFQYGSLHQKIEPMVIRFRDWGRECIIRLERGSEVATLDRIEKVYESFHPKYHFEAAYLEDDYSALYNTERRESVISNYMAVIAIIISCLGLFGLSSFTAQRRTKEIGVRKILGASHLTIMRLLTSTFTKTVIVAVALAIPLGYYVSTYWLRNFAYAVDVHWLVFAVAGISSLLIAWFTVAFQTYKAANVNPVQSLRHE